MPGEVIAALDLIERDDGGAIRYHYTLVDFTAEALSFKLQAGDDAIDAKWFDRDDLSDLGLWSETVRIIDLAAGKRQRNV